MPNFFKCIICKADGISERNLAKHHAKHTKLHPNIPGIDQIFELSTKGKYKKCDVCGVNLPKSRLEKHMQFYHQKTNTSNPKLKMQNVPKKQNTAAPKSMNFCDKAKVI